MSKIVDLLGLRFGRLIVISLSEKRIHKKKVWTCQCDCGLSTDVIGSSLTRGFTKSCGCLRKDVSARPKRSDLIGKKFSRLEVIRQDGMEGNSVKWLCLCQCGSETHATAGALNSGHKQSCGCLNRDMVSAATRSDLEGVRSGRLVAIELVGTKNGNALWLCRCDCGTEKVIPSVSIKLNRVISCGCALKDKPGMRPEKIRKVYACYASTRRAMLLDADGSFTPEQISQLFKKQKSKCASCLVKLGKDFHRDHIVALSIGGSNDIYNIQLLCQLCNQRKHAKTPEVWAKENGRLL